LNCNLIFSLTGSNEIYTTKYLTFRNCRPIRCDSESRVLLPQGVAIFQRFEYIM